MQAAELLGLRAAEPAPAAGEPLALRGSELLAEAERQLRVCNACRYCAGYCAVFPALSLRRSPSGADVLQLAQLCFECRACYYACQYAPPHEFAVNLPRVLAEVRIDTYASHAWPRPLGALFRRNALAVALLAAGSVAAVLGLVLALQEPAVLFSAQRGAGAFYSVVPYAAMVIPAAVLSLYAAAVLAAGFLRFWRATGAPRASGSPPPIALDWRAFARAARDVLRLEYARGGGAGCNYPDERFSHARRRWHQLVLGGFLLDFASTTVAAGYENALGLLPPYAFWSLPVLLGTAGGVLLLAGCCGLLALKARSDRAPAAEGMFGMDVAFTVLLALTAATGLLLLAQRETAAMGSLLALHLGAVCGFFLTMPYGKFAHVAYRWAALVRHAAEQRNAPPSSE